MNIPQPEQALTAGPQVAEPISLEPRLEPDLLALGGGASSRAAMPPDLLDDIARRLRFAGLLICGLAPVSFIVGLVIGHTLPLGVRIATAVTTLAAGGAVAWLAGRPALSPSRLLGIGSAFAVLVALIISAASVPMTWFASQRAGVLWSPVAVWVLVFPLIVPATRRRTMVTACLAAATEPAVVLSLVLLGRQPIAVRRGVGQRPDQDHQVRSGNLLCPGGAALADAAALSRTDNERV